MTTIRHVGAAAIATALWNKPDRAAAALRLIHQGRITARKPAGRWVAGAGLRRQQPLTPALLAMLVWLAECGAPQLPDWGAQALFCRLADAVDDRVAQVQRAGGGFA
ncbi:MAG TPA: hypothetical protein VGC26_12060 [Afipia sp.]